MSRRPRNPEAGFALLLVYAMAATFAIMLYMQLPRIAFEAQREREQLLIDRGQQYTRAVQLYVRKFQRFPADIDALEKTQNIRFLRKQYVDPMTGKNEWRLIHVGPGGVFTDSQVFGNQQKKIDDSPKNFITEMQPVGGNPTGPEGVNLATRRRASDGFLPGGDPGSNNGAGAGNGTAGSGSAGNSTAIVNGPVMVLPDGRIVPATSTGIPAATPAPAAPVPGQPGTPLGMPSGGNSQIPNSGQPNMGGGPPNSAANLINQILTTPRPQPGQPSQGQFGGELAGGNGQPIPQTQGQTIGGGIAGVASKYEQEGIKLYNERSAYNQWEFVYDMTKDPARTGAAQQGASQGVQQATPAGASSSGTGTGLVSPPK